MVDKIAFENGRISNFQGLLDRDILHTVVHHSSTSTYMPNFIEIEETFCGWTNGRMDRHLRPTLLGRLKRVDLNLRMTNKQSWNEAQLVKVQLKKCNIYAFIRQENRIQQIGNGSRTNDI